MKKIRVYMLDFDTQAMSMIVQVEDLNNDNSDIQYDELCSLLGTDGFDVLEYNDDLKEFRF